LERADCRIFLRFLVLHQVYNDLVSQPNHLAALIAQLVERVTSNDEVAGSTPS
jgi:hypothetical protein